MGSVRRCLWLGSVRQCLWLGSVRRCLWLRRPTASELPACRSPMTLEVVSITMNTSKEVSLKSSNSRNAPKQCDRRTFLLSVLAFFAYRKPYRLQAPEALTHSSTPFDMTVVNKPYNGGAVVLKAKQARLILGHTTMHY